MVEGRGNRPPPTLRRKSDFRRIVRTGRRVRHDFLQIAFLPSAAGEKSDGDRETGRAGYVIPERIIKGAVRRNRLRRLLREAARHWWSSIRPGHDIVLQVGRSPRFDHAGYAEKIFLELLIKADLLNGEGRSKAEARIRTLSGIFRGSKLPVDDR